MQKKSVNSDLEILANLPVKVDYLLLKDRFSRHKNPKKKIFDLKEKGHLQQIKRGQYFNIKSKEIETTSYEVIANSLYFPSYVSMEWALQHYGLIMERVSTVTSVTTLRSKKFQTPYGPFSYAHIAKKRYPAGYTTKVISQKESFLIAKPEKALLDYITIKAKNLIIANDDNIQEFLENDLRLDLVEFNKNITLPDLTALMPFYHRNSKEHRILKWLAQQKKRSP